MRPIAFLSVLLATLLSSSPGAAAAGDWAWPVRGDVLTPFRNGDDPYAAGQHRGVDIAAAPGTPVVAAARGTVVWAGVVGSSGLTVAERTADGAYELSYLHLSAVSVRRGQTVAAGERLGAVGVSGTRSVAQPHLHFGVREAGDRHAYVDPLRFLPPPPARAPDPRPAPVPAGEPVRAVPAPATAPGRVSVPAAAPAPLPAPAPFRVPVPAPRPALEAPGPGRVPVRTPTPVGHPAAALRSGPHRAALAQPSAPRGGAHHAPHADHRRQASHVRAASHGPRAQPTAQGEPAAAPAPHRRASAGGIDLGWLAACIGLIAAAALLGSPRAGGGGRLPGRGAYRTLLRASSGAGDA
jgi:hypothetical protein